MRLLERRPVLPIAIAEALLPLELLLAPALVARLLGILERLARIAVLATRPPVAAAMLAARSTFRWTRRAAPAIALGRFPLPLARSACVAVAIVPARRPRRLRGIPQLAAGKPLHLGIGMLFPQPLKRRHQLFALGGTKRRREAAGDDGPVGVARGHWRLLHEGLRAQGPGIRTVRHQEPGYSSRASVQKLRTSCRPVRPELRTPTSPQSFFGPIGDGRDYASRRHARHSLRSAICWCGRRQWTWPSAPTGGTGLPKADQMVLGFQLRKSSVSMPSNIAEGFSRHSTPFYVQHLWMSHASGGELRNARLSLGARLHLVTPEHAEATHSGRGGNWSHDQGSSARCKTARRRLGTGCFRRPGRTWTFALIPGDRDSPSPSPLRPERDRARRQLVTRPQSAQLLDQRRALDAEQLRGLVAVAARAVERALDQILLDRGEIGRQVQPAVGKLDERRCRRLRRRLHLGRQVRDVDLSRPALSATARSTAFSSWRTLPGHGYAISCRIAPCETSVALAANFSRKCFTSSGMSSRRSRSGGSCTGMTLSR